MINKEYALLCEFATMSTNGMQSYMHVFDRSTYPTGTPLVLRGFFATRLTGLPAEGEVEIYVTDADKTLVEKSQLLKNKIKGPSANVVIRIGALQVPKAGEYSIWCRVDGGEAMRLCSWIAEEKATA